MSLSGRAIVPLVLVAGALPLLSLLAPNLSVLFYLAGFSAVVLALVFAVRQARRTNEKVNIAGMILLFVVATAVMAALTSQTLPQN